MKQIFKKVQKDSLRRWTDLAKECYSINSNCANCEFIPKHLKYICQVKYYLPYLKEKFGEPK